MTDQQLKPPTWLYVRRGVVWTVHHLPVSFGNKWTTHTTRRGARRPFDWRPPFLFCGELRPPWRLEIRDGAARRNYLLVGRV